MFVAELRDVLHRAGVGHTVIADRVVCFGTPYEIHAEVHATRPPIVRLSTIVTSGIHVGPELLAELNEANAGLANIRLWAEHGAIVATTDLPMHRIADIVDTATLLTRELRSDHSSPAFPDRRASGVRNDDSTPT